jgi:cystathionine beta-lyase
MLNTSDGIAIGTPIAAHLNPLEDLSLEQLRRRGSMKWATYPADILPLWVADMDVRLAPAIATALHQAIDDGDTGYPAGTGLAEAFKGFAARRWQWNDIDLGRVARIPDVMMGAVQVLRLVTDPGDAVVVNTPVYAPYFAFVPNDGRKIVEAPLGDEGRIDLDALSEAFERARASSRNVAYLLCNPHNPTGTVHTAEELRGVAELARRHGVRVVADEIHAPLVLPGAIFTPYLSVPGAEDAFSLTSAAKGWNLAGLKAALVVAGPEAAADLQRLPAEVILGSSYLGVIAHTAAFTAGDKWLDGLITGLAGNRDLLTQLIAEHLPEVRFKAPEATYLAWLDCRALGFEVEERTEGIAFASDLAGPAKMFLDQGRVAVSSGHIFGSGGSGHVRLNYATSGAILSEALSRMGRAARASR